MQCRKTRRFLKRIMLLALILACAFASAVWHVPFHAARAAGSGTLETADGYPYTTTTYESVNLREKRSVNSGVVLVIHAGAAVTVLNVTDSWAAVEYDGVLGYVKTEYLALRIPGGTVCKGANETDTKLVQQRLMELGYYQGEIDGTF